MRDIATKKSDDTVVCFTGSGGIGLDSFDTGTYNHYLNQNVDPPTGLGIPLSAWTYTPGGGFTAV